MRRVELALLAMVGVVACTPGGLSAPTTSSSGPGATLAAATSSGTSGSAAASSTGTTVASTTGVSSAASSASTASSSSTSSGAVVASTGSSSSSSSGTAVTSSSSSSSSGGVCGGGVPCCGWAWSALDATCPTSFGFIRSAPPSTRLFATDGTSLYELAADAGRTTLASATIGAFALWDAGDTFVALGAEQVDEVTTSGATSLGSIASFPFAYGVAASDSALFFSTSHGAFALDPSGLTTLWSTEYSAYMDVDQLLDVGSSSVVLGASNTAGAVAYSAATGSYCYTERCTVPDGGVVTESALQADGVAIDPTSGTLYLVGNAPGGGLVEALGADGSCGFLHAATNGCDPVTGPCAAACEIDSSLDDIMLSEAAFVGGVLYAAGYNPTDGFTYSLFTYSAAGGLRTFSSGMTEVAGGE